MPDGGVLQHVTWNGIPFCHFHIFYQKIRIFHSRKLLISHKRLIRDVTVLTDEWHLSVKSLHDKMRVIPSSTRESSSVYQQDMVLTFTTYLLTQLSGQFLFFPSIFHTSFIYYVMSSSRFVDSRKIFASGSKISLSTLTGWASFRWVGSNNFDWASLTNRINAAWSSWYLI